MLNSRPTRRHSYYCNLGCGLQFRLSWKEVTDHTKEIPNHCPFCGKKGLSRTYK